MINDIQQHSATDNIGGLSTFNYADIDSSAQTKKKNILK